MTGKAPPPAHPPKRIVSRETGAALSTCCIIQQFDSDSSGRGEPFQLTRTSFCISAVYLFQQIEQTGNGLSRLKFARRLNATAEKFHVCRPIDELRSTIDLALDLH